MTNQLNLYPKIKPYDSGFLNVDQHQVYFEQCGNPINLKNSYLKLGELLA
jgi:hypothetical protein